MDERADVADLPKAVSLTSRQMEVLSLVEQRLTIKEIAARLDVSESAINQRIRAIKGRLGANTHRELAQFYRIHHEGGETDSTCRETACRINHLHTIDNPNETSGQDEIGSVASFSDSMSFKIDAPWVKEVEPRIVPRVLDGEGAGWSRGVAIMVIVVAIFAAIIVGLGAAQGITEAIKSRTTVPQENVFGRDN